MKKSLLILLLSLFTTAFSQIRFEKGYYINNGGEKTDVLIKNEDWNLNPTFFTYRLSEDGANLTGKISEVKEFGVYNFSKYVKFTGSIDQSTDELQILSDMKEPEWAEKTVFLKQLVAGKRNLYIYNDSKIRKYFYSDQNTPIEQLVYKRYFQDGDKSKAYSNNEYQNQLSRFFAGENTGKEIETIDYKAQNLTNLFEKFNADSGMVELKSDSKKSKLNLYVKPGVAISSASITFTEFADANVKFESKISPRFSLELEYVLPIRKNKWSVFVEPTYQSYNQKGKNFTNNEAEIKYSVIEIPIGVRHYMFINKDSRIFLEGVVNLGEFKTGENTIRYAIPGTTSEKQFDILADINFGFGLGYSYKNKWLISVRQYTNKNISKEFKLLNLRYHNLTIMAAYNIF